MSDFAFDLQQFAEDEGAQDNAPDTATGTETTDSTDNTQPDEASDGTLLTGNNQPETKPESNVPESYDFQKAVPEGMQYDEAAATAFGALAKECNLSQEQASKLATYGMQFAQQSVGGMFKAMADGWANEVRTELGNEYDGTISKAATAVQRLETKIPGLSEAFNKTGAGNRIEFVRLMALVGDMVGEDGGVDSGIPATEKTVYGNTNFDLYK